MGHLRHLDQEGTSSLGDVVGRADAGKDAVDQADVGRLGRHKAANMGHEHDKGHLADQDAFAGHVRAGDEQQPLAGAEAGIVGHKRLTAGQCLLDDWAAPVADVDQIAVIDLRPDVTVPGGDLGQSSQGVELGQNAGRGQQPVGLGSDLAP